MPRFVSPFSISLRRLVLLGVDWLSGMTTTLGDVQLVGTDPDDRKGGHSPQQRAVRTEAEMSIDKSIGEAPL